MNSLTILTLFACFFWGFFTGMYGRKVHGILPPLKGLQKAPQRERTHFL